MVEVVASGCPQKKEQKKEVGWSAGGEWGLLKQIWGPTIKPQSSPPVSHFSQLRLHLLTFLLPSK